MAQPRNHSTRARRTRRPTRQEQPTRERKSTRSGQEGIGEQRDSAGVGGGQRDSTGTGEKPDRGRQGSEANQADSSSRGPIRADKNRKLERSTRELVTRLVLETKTAVAKLSPRPTIPPVDCSRSAGLEIWECSDGQTGAGRR